MITLSFTYIFIAIIVLIYFGSMGNPEITDLLLFSSHKVRKKKQWYRLFSSSLVHLGFVHLAMNSIAIYYFAPIVETSFGTGITTLVFVLSVLGGSLFPLWLRRKDHDYLALGASGGVSGLVMFSMFLIPDMQVGMFLIPIYLPAWIFGIIFCISSVVLTQTPDRNRISHEGHLGGLFFGGCLALLFIPNVLQLRECAYLFWAGIFPIFLFILMQTIKPAWFYRKNYR